MPRASVGSSAARLSFDLPRSKNGERCCSRPAAPFGGGELPPSRPAKSGHDRRTAGAVAAPRVVAAEANEGARDAARILRSESHADAGPPARPHPFGPEPDADPGRLRCDAGRIASSGLCRTVGEGERSGGDPPTGRGAGRRGGDVAGRGGEREVDCRDRALVVGRAARGRGDGFADPASSDRSARDRDRDRGVGGGLRDLEPAAAVVERRRGRHERIEGLPKAGDHHDWPAPDPARAGAGAGPEEHHLGIAGLTRGDRRAVELGAGTMTLYWHFTDKRELLDAVIGTAVAGLKLPRFEGSWRDQIRQLAAYSRELLARHPSVLEIWARQPVLAADTLGGVEAGLRILEEAGFDPEEAVKAFRLLVTYTFGFELFSEPRSKRATRESARAALRKLPPEGYPHLSETAGPFAAAMGSEEAFAYGLDRILDGL